MMKVENKNKHKVKTFLLKLKPILAPIFKFATEKPATFLSLGYAYIVFCGGMFEIGYFLYFGINIIQFATVQDFLLSPIGGRFSLFISIIGLCFLLWVAAKFYRDILDFSKGKREEAWSYRNLYLVLALSLILLVSPSFLGMFGGWATCNPHKWPLRIEWPYYTITLRSYHGENQVLKDVLFIGNTSEYLFFQESDNKKTTYTIPASNIEVLRFSGFKLRNKQEKSGCNNKSP